MAEVRTSAKQTAARTRARENAAQFRAKQDTLEQLAADYFVAAGSLDDIEVATSNEITALHERAAKQSATARGKAAAVIAAMLDLGAPRNEVADRLGIALREVRKLPGTAPVATVAPPA